MNSEVLFMTAAWSIIIGTLVALGISIHYS
jgi:hypothetical protein